LALDLDRKTQDLVQSSLLGEVLDAAPVAVFVGDESLRYLAVNRAGCELVGYTREELTGLGVADVVELTPEEFESAYGDFVQNGGRRADLTIRRKDGTRLDVSHATYRSSLGGMPVFIALVEPR
jgi:PAS domain S-box-containing protein